MSRTAPSRRAHATRPGLRSGRSPHALRVAEIGREVGTLLDGFTAQRLKTANHDASERDRHVRAIAEHVEQLRLDLEGFLGQVRKQQSAANRRSARDRADAVAGVQEWVGGLRTEIRKSSAARRAAYRDLIDASTTDRLDALAAIRASVERMIAEFNGYAWEPAARATAPAASDASPATTVQRLTRESTPPERAPRSSSRRAR